MQKNDFEIFFPYIFPYIISQLSDKEVRRNWYGKS
jgi:hypothetical protein